jgi:hypothetical protein
MQVTIHSTSHVVILTPGREALFAGYGPVQARIWEGTAEDGTPVHCYIVRISPQTHDPAALTQFARDLQETAPPTAAVEAIPLRLVL